MKNTNKSYRRKEYEIVSKKVKEPLTFVLLADLHGTSYGIGNHRLVKSIESEKPDFIFVAGDMLSARKNPRKWGQNAVADLMTELADRTNVCYARGNHESKMERNIGRFGRIIAKYEEKLARAGAVSLHNESRDFFIKNTKITVSGLELTSEYFKKFRARKLTNTGLKKMLGDGERESYHVLLAHSPQHGDTYFDWGADLILSGHNHGGVMGFPGCGGVITPQFRLFDKYTAGQFDRENQTLIVSRGLGDHMPLLRIFNPREYVVMKIRPAKEIQHGN